MTRSLPGQPPGKFREGVYGLGNAKAVLTWPIHSNRPCLFPFQTVCCDKFYADPPGCPAYAAC